MDSEERRDNGGLSKGVRDKLSLTIPYDPPNWNAYISAERNNKYQAAGIKRREKGIVVECCNGMRYDGRFPVQVTIKAHFANHRKDLDNTRYKGVIDGLVSCGVLPNDNLKIIQRIVIEPVFDGADQMDIIIEPIM